jgi:hypothetical protein
MFCELKWAGFLMPNMVNLEIQYSFSTPHIAEKAGPSSQSCDYSQSPTGI